MSVYPRQPWSTTRVYNFFKNSIDSLQDGEQSGRLAISRNQENLAKVPTIVNTISVYDHWTNSKQNWHPIHVGS